MGFAGKQRAHDLRLNPGPTVLMLLTNAYEPDPRVRQEALGLVELGCRVRLLAWDRDRKHVEYESMEGVEIQRVFLSSTHGRGTSQIFFYAALYGKLLFKGWRTRFDVVHCHDLDTLPVGFLLGKFKNKPVVYDAHESFPDMLFGRVPSVLQRIIAALERTLIRRVDLLITVGEKLRQHFDANGARRAVVVGNWKKNGDYDSTDQQNRETRERLGIPVSALVIVCITNLLNDRKLEELLSAVESCSDVYLIVGGAGVLESVVIAAAKRTPRIVFLGFVPAREIPVYTCAADVVYYGFDPANPNARFSAPNKLYEALAAGRPLITGDFGEIADVVRAAECGVILPEYTPSAIRQAFGSFADRDVRRRMADNAKRFGRSSASWEKGQQVLRDEYSRMIGTPLGVRNTSPETNATVGTNSPTAA